MQLLVKKKSVLSRHEDTELLGMYQGAKGAPATEKRQVARRRLEVNKKAPSGWDGDAFADGAKSAKRELSSQDGKGQRGEARMAKSASLVRKEMIA